MRSSFNSFYSSTSPSAPLSFNSSSSLLSTSSSSSQLGFRRSSGAGSSIERGSLSFRERDPLGARYPNRSSSLAGRAQPTSSDLGSRVTRDEQTVGLLERYGNGARKTSVGETPTSQFLKQRRQQQQQYETSDNGFGGASTSSQRRQSLDNFGLRTVADPFSTTKKESPSTSSADPQSNDYMQRLLAAHNRVDELLKSRGLNGEDERKYLRAWEEIPIIREERYRRVRTPSSSSDSGLSTDNDSDRSNSEPAVAAAAEAETSETFSFDQDEEDIQVVHVHKVYTKVKDAVTFTYKIKTADIELKKKAKSEKIEKSYKIKASEIPPTPPKQCHLSVANSNDINAIKPKKNDIMSTRAIFPFRQNAKISMTLPAAPTPKQLMNARKELKKVETNTNCSQMLKSAGQRKQQVEKCFVDDKNKKPITVRATFCVKEKKAPIPKRRKTYDDNVKVQQKCVLANLKPKKDDALPSTAEISIQHCSFYTQAKENFAERNVRLNLRMTERAPKNCMAIIVLPSPPRVIYVRKDVSIFMKPKVRRTKTQELKKPAAAALIGKLNRSFTVELEKEEKELRKVNRLKIPEYFLQSSAEAMEDISGVKSGLKRVPIIGGFLIAPKPKVVQQPQSTLRRAGAIRRKPTPIKEESAPYSDFCPPIPRIRIQQAVEPDPPPPPRSRRQPPSSLSNHLNFHGSLVLPAKPRGAKHYESQKQHQQQQHFAELSETDKILIERFNSRMHIPRPRAIIRALSPFNAYRAIRSQIKERYSSPPPKVEFLQRPRPRCRSPTPSREIKPLRLNPIQCSHTSKSQQRRHWLDFHVDLKKVDHEKHRLRKKPRRCLIRWIPKWRRRGTDEEVEEVEEDQEEEAELVEDDAATEISTKSERTKTKSFTDDDEGMTEGARAMAAAKRRHEEDQQAKLMDYEERRRIEREKEEEELKKLKEKQERRKLEREQEEKEMEERRRAAEDRRRLEEDERRVRVEEEKRKKEEEKNRRNQFVGGGFSNSGSGRNFSIPKKGANNDKFGNIVQAKQEMGMTKEQQDEAKRAFLASIRKEMPPASELLPADLKIKIKELHQRICKLEAAKYDLEKRHERQEYDLKELNERQRQVTRNAALKKGIDPAEVGNSRYPPKLPIISKFERKDERSFNDRKALFSNQKNLDDEMSSSCYSTSSKIPDDIQAYLKSPDRCPKYSEKETTYIPKCGYQPKALKIPSAFLQSG